MTVNNESLYSLTDRMVQLLNFVEQAENPEELAESIAETKELLEMSIDDKLEGIMTIRQNKLARVSALEDEAKRLTELAKKEKTQIAKMEKYAEDELTRLGYSYKDKKNSVKAVGKFNMKFKKLPPKLEIIDAKKIPSDYMNIPPTPAAQPDKKELLDLLKKKAEFLHGKKWTKEIDELKLEDFGIRLVNNNQKFEIE
jgi:hypothetical protein